MAYSLTPPQPITGDDQHLLAEEKQYEKKKKTEKYLERSEEFLRGQLVKTFAKTNNRFIHLVQHVV